MAFTLEEEEYLKALVAVGKLENKIYKDTLALDLFRADLQSKNDSDIKGKSSSQEKNIKILENEKAEAENRLKNF